MKNVQNYINVLGNLCNLLYNNPKVAKTRLIG